MKVSEACNPEVCGWQPLESQVKLSVEEVRRDDLNLDQFAAKAEQGGNKMDKSKFGISVGHGDRAMVKGQSLTTRAGDLIEFIFAKESIPPTCEVMTNILEDLTL